MIGILDSGLGGLSVTQEIQKLLPNTSLTYVADSAWCPYGSKDYPLIQERVLTITDFLINQGAETIVIACNSATIACVEYLRSVYPIPIIGMEPGVKPAAKITKTNTIGIFATEASLAGEKFHRLLNNHTQGLNVITQHCPKFVTLVEEGKLAGEDVSQAIKQYTDPMIEAGVDTIVLGCTHYPFLKSAISHLYPDIHLIDTGEAVAKEVVRRKKTLDTAPRLHHFYSSGKLEQARKVLNQLRLPFSFDHYHTLPNDLSSRK